MSYIDRNPKTSSRRKMVTRQQISDILSYGQIITNASYAKTTQVFLEKLITLSKNPTLESKRKAHSILLNTKKFSKQELVKRLFEDFSKKYENRNGGYTRLLKTEKGCLIQLV